jgi:spermidine/putrescine-binding protein
MPAPLRLIVWPGMPDRGALEAAGRRIGRELEIEVISSNEDLEDLLESEPPFDLITPSDYLVEKLVAEDRLIDLSERFAGRRADFEDWARNPSWDPDEKFCVPLAFGTTGLLHSSRQLPDLESWSQFFEPAPGMKVGLLDEVREVVGAALIAAGHSPNETASGPLDDAGRLLDAQRDAVGSVSSDDFTGPVERGEVEVHQAWSGPASLSVRQNPDLAYLVPREGALLWVTTGAIPADAPDPEAAARLLEALIEPELASLAVIYGGYSTPNRKAREILSPTLQADRALFPDEETILRCQVLSSLSPDGERAMADLLDRHAGGQEREVDSRI